MIRFPLMGKKLRSKIKERLDDLYSNWSPSMANVKNWFHKFQCFRSSVFDEPHTGLLRGITGHKYTISNHWYTPETKEHLIECISPDEPYPKKAKSVVSVGKAMTRFTWIRKICSLYLTTWGRAKQSRGSTMRSYYANSTPSCKKTDTIWQREAGFQYDNSPAYISAIATAKLIQ